MAVLAVTFMPTITRALSVRADGVDVCSAYGSSGSAPADGQHALEHCPYCALHADLALPPTANAAFEAPLRLRALPVAFLQAPRASAVWATAQPRAPPAFA